jgi:flagellar FliL protein
MAEEVKSDDLKPAKKPKRIVFIGLILGILFGGLGFLAVYSGLILAPNDKNFHKNDRNNSSDSLPNLVFVPLDPIVINIGSGSTNRHLRFRAELEVEPDQKSQVMSALPRITDILNTYLRSVKVSDLQEPFALIKLRSQMLRRIQMVTGEYRVRDLLVMEFVLN